MNNCLTIIIAATTQLFSLNVPDNTAKAIGDKIWINECAGKVEGLTHWNIGEDFGSFGIGHFIWYPENGKELYQDTFPMLIKYLANQGVVVPSWLAKAKGCPWPTREAFYRDIDSPKMKELRRFLVETKDKQAVFMAWRLEN